MCDSGCLSQKRLHLPHALSINLHKVFDIFLVDFSVLTTLSLFRAFCVSLHVLGFLMKFQPIKII